MVKVTDNQQTLVTNLRKQAEHLSQDANTGTYTFAIKKQPMKIYNVAGSFKRKIKVIQIDVNKLTGMITEIRCYSQDSMTSLQPTHTYEFARDVTHENWHQQPVISLHWKGTKPRPDIIVPKQEPSQFFKDEKFDAKALPPHQGFTFKLLVEDGKNSSKEAQGLYDCTVNSKGFAKTLTKVKSDIANAAPKHIEDTMLNDEVFTGPRIHEFAADAPKGVPLPAVPSQLAAIYKKNQGKLPPIPKRHQMMCKEPEEQKHQYDADDSVPKPGPSSSSGAATPEEPIIPYDVPETAQVAGEHTGNRRIGSNGLILNAAPVPQNEDLAPPLFADLHVTRGLPVPSINKKPIVAEPDPERPAKHVPVSVGDKPLIINAKELEDSSSSVSEELPPAGAIKVVTRRRCMTQVDQISENMSMLLALIPLIIVILMYLFKRSNTPTVNVAEKRPRDDEHHDYNFGDFV